MYSSAKLSISDFANRYRCYSIDQEIVGGTYSNPLVYENIITIKMDDNGFRALLGDLNESELMRLLNRPRNKALLDRYMEFVASLLLEIETS
jgi:hypothetical protein